MRLPLQSLSANLAQLDKLDEVSSSRLETPAHALRHINMYFAARVVLTSSDVMVQARCHAGSGRHSAGRSCG